MPTSVLLPIKPEYAERIFNGSKQFEFRRRIFRNPSVQKVVVYVTAPVSRVVGEFEIEGILELEIERLWEETKEESGIPQDRFETYFCGRQIGYAIKIGRTRTYKTPLELRASFNLKRAPQSFVYVND
jgi:predicted transcriptional regulator